MNQKQIEKEKKVFIDELKSMKRTLKRQDYGPHTKLFLKVWFDMIVDKFNKSKNGKDFQDSIHILFYIVYIGPPTLLSLLLLANLL